MMPYPINPVALYQTMGIFPTQNTDDAGKIFVGGIPADATIETLTEYFNQFGEVSDCIIMVDNVTGRSRGFGFVTFLDQSSVRHVLSHPNKHSINGKVVDAKKAVPKGPNQSSILKAMGVTSNRADRNPECKVFVGGVAQGTTETDLANYFEEFGKVLEVKIPKDQSTQRARGFSFVLFENRKSVEKATRDRYHVINNKTVEVKTVHLSPSTLSDRGSDEDPAHTPPSPFPGVQQRPNYYSFPQYYGIGTPPYYDTSGYEAPPSASSSSCSIASTGSAGVGNISGGPMGHRMDEYYMATLYQPFNELSLSHQSYAAGAGRGYHGAISRTQFAVPSGEHYPSAAYSPSPTTGTPIGFQPPAPIIPHGTSPPVYAAVSGQHPTPAVPPAHIPIPVTAAHAANIPSAVTSTIKRI